MNLPIPIPEAWQGFSHNPKTGEFMVKVCFTCPDAARAIQEAKPLKTVETLCQRCYNQQLDARMGEK